MSSTLIVGCITVGIFIAFDFVKYRRLPNVGSARTCATDITNDLLPDLPHGLTADLHHAGIRVFAVPQVTKPMFAMALEDRAGKFILFDFAYTFVEPHILAFIVAHELAHFSFEQRLGRFVLQNYRSYAISFGTVGLAIDQPSLPFIALSVVMSLLGLIVAYRVVDPRLDTLLESRADSAALQVVTPVQALESLAFLQNMVARTHTQGELTRGLASRIAGMRQKLDRVPAVEK